MCISFALFFRVVRHRPLGLLHYSSIVPPCVSPTIERFRCRYVYILLEHYAFAKVDAQLPVSFEIPFHQTTFPLCFWWDVKWSESYRTSPIFTLWSLSSTGRRPNGTLVRLWTRIVGWCWAGRLVCSILYWLNLDLMMVADDLAALEQGLYILDCTIDIKVRGK